MRTPPQKLLWLLLVWSGLALSSPADLIHTVDGRVYEGVVTEEDDATVTIVLPVGQVQIPRSSIARIERKPVAAPTAIPTSTPRPTNTRVPTATPLETPTPSPRPTRTPVPTPTLIGDQAPPYSPEEADRLIAKYEKVRLPKAKYVLAYDSKGLQAEAEDKRSAAIQAWTTALEMNERLFAGPPSGDEAAKAPAVLEERFEAALETLRLEAKRDPAAPAVMNRVCQRALRDVNLLLSWIDRQFTLHVRLARLYQKMQTTQQQAVEHYLKAYRLLSEQRRGYQLRVEEMTAQGDPFNLRGLFFVPRTEVNGLLMDSRLAEIERILDEDFDLQPDDYLYDYE